MVSISDILKLVLLPQTILLRNVRTVRDAVDGIRNPVGADEQATDEIGQAIEQVSPATEVSAAVVDVVEEFILAELEEEGQLTPENVEQVADDVEGGAVSVLLGLGLAGSAVEGSTLGQVDQQQEYITQAVAALGVEDVTGTELDARLNEGIAPALEAKANADHRSKFADLNDAIEQDLRNKDSDTGYTSDLSTYGIRPDNVPILEEVALQQIEFEELLETPAELGKIVPEDVLNEELDRAGYAEDTKDFLRETAQSLERSARTYQELLVAEELVRALDTLARSEALSPQEAVDEIPDEVEADMSAFKERFRRLRDLPAGTPSGTDFEGAFASGYLTLEELRDRLDATDYPTDQYTDVLRKQVLDEIDGDLQEAVGLGLLSPEKYSDYAEFAGLDDETTSLLLQGRSFSDITKARLQEQTSPDSQQVGTLVGVGESRARALADSGIQTVSDMVNADPQRVADVAQVSPETAQEFIDQATQRTQ